MIKAIPTLYAGAMFRSRLEARWAAFFDTCGWRWSYEPVDASGYVPDFALWFARPLFVEVKPVMWTDSDEEAEVIQAARTKAVHSGITGELLLLGTRIITGERFHVLGSMMSIDEDGVSPWSDAFAFNCNMCGGNSIASEQQSWHCRARGCYDGREHLEEWDADFDFRRAGSEVQWRPGQ